MDKHFHLGELKIGQIGRVIALHTGNAELKQRLLDMGITKGVTVEIVRHAPLGDPISIKLRGYQLCLRKKDLQQIDIEVLA